MSDYYYYISSDGNSIGVVDDEGAAYTGDLTMWHTKTDTTLVDTWSSEASGSFTITVIDYDGLDGDYLTVDGSPVYFGVGDSNITCAENIKDALVVAGHSATRLAAKVVLTGATTCTGSDDSNMSVVAGAVSGTLISPSPSFNSRYHIELVWGALMLMGFNQYADNFYRDIKRAKANKDGKKVGTIRQWDY